MSSNYSAELDPASVMALDMNRRRARGATAGQLFRFAEPCSFAGAGMLAVFVGLEPIDLVVLLLDGRPVVTTVNVMSFLEVA